MVSCCTIKDLRSSITLHHHLLAGGAAFFPLFPIIEAKNRMTELESEDWISSPMFNLVRSGSHTRPGFKSLGPLRVAIFKLGFHVRIGAVKIATKKKGAYSMPF